MKFIKNWALLLSQLLVVCAFNKYAMNVNDEFVFIDSAIAVLLANLVNERARIG